MKTRIQAKQKFFGSTNTIYDEHLNIVNIKDSDLESHFYVLKRIQGVEFIKSQPEPLFYLLDSKKTRYTADFEVIEDGIRYFIEIKNFAKTQSKDFKDKVAFLTEQYKKQGIIFKVVTEKDIYDGDNVINALMLLPCLRHPAPILEYKKLVIGLDDSRTYSMKEMNTIAKERGIDIIVVKRAVAHRLFTVELARPFEKWQLSITKLSASE